MKQKGGKKLKLESIYIVINNEIRKKYVTKAECARNMGITRQRLNQILSKLKNNNEISFNNVKKFLNFFGYEIKIIKKRG